VTSCSKEDRPANLDSVDLIAVKDTLYFPDGRVQKITSFEDSVKNGLEIEFFMNGNKRTTVNHENGWRHGVSEEFYENGSIKRRSNYFDDNKVGHELIYNEDGNLRFYVTRDYEERVQFRAEYNSNDSLIKVEGYIATMYWVDNREVNFIYAMPPGTKVEFYIEVADQLDTTILIDDFSIGEIQSQFYLGTLNQPFKIYSELYDSASQKLLVRDTLLSEHYAEIL